MRINKEEHKWTIAGIGLPVEILCNFEISITDKLLFGFIQNLCKTKRGCWATNTYLAQYLNIHPNSIPRCLQNLQNYKYINIEFVEISQGVKERRIYENTEYKELYKPFSDVFNDNIEDLKSLNILEGVNGRVKGGKRKGEGGLTEGLTKENKEENKLNTSKEVLEQQVAPNTSCTDNITRPVLLKRKEVLDKPKPTPKNKVLVKEISIAAQAKSILNYWENKGLKVPKETTETYKTNLASCRNILNGKLFDRQYSKQEVLKAIENYSLAALNPKFQPINKVFLQKQYFHQFVWNNYSTNGDISLFQKYLETEPQVIKEAQTAMKPINPAILDVLINWYRSNVLGGIGGDFTETQKNEFIHGANKIVHFYDEHKKRFTPFGFTDISLAKTLCEYFEEQMRNKFVISPSTLTHKTTFETYFPQYLKQKGIISELPKFTSYNQAH